MSKHAWNIVSRPATAGPFMRSLGREGGKINERRIQNIRQEGWSGWARRD